MMNNNKVEVKHLEIESMDDLKEKIKNNKDTNCEYKVSIEEAALDQESLENLSSSMIGLNMSSLECRPDYDDDVPIIDFSKVHFPKLRSIELYCQGVKAVHFTKENTPLLESFDLESNGPQPLEYFCLDLPNLVSLSFQFVEIANPSDFGKSLSKCSNLKSVNCYKLFGLGVPKSKTHNLVLPRCKSLDFYRSDDLNYLKIWAPHLECLNLQACYAIDEVTILNNKPNGYTGPAYTFTGTPSKYRVNCLNTTRPKGNLITHPRCGIVFPPTDDNHEEYDPFEWLNIPMPK